MWVVVVSQCTGSDPVSPSLCVSLVTDLTREPTVTGFVRYLWGHDDEGQDSPDHYPERDTQSP